MSRWLARSPPRPNMRWALSSVMGSNQMLIRTSRKWGVDCTRPDPPLQGAWHCRPGQGRMHCCTAKMTSEQTMAEYQAPLQQMRFTIEHLAEFKEVVALPAYAAVDAETAEAVLEEAGKFANGVLSPTNWPGDRKGVKVVDKAVQVPEEFFDAYAQFRDGGWPGIAANPEFGGQGLPKTISIACDEMWSSANVAFALCPELS